MWFPVTLLLLVGVAVATPDHKHGWQRNNKYQYRVETQTLAGVMFNELTGQYTGLDIQGILEIDVISPETLKASLLDVQYAPVHEKILDFTDIRLDKSTLNYRPLHMSGKQFEIKLKHGLIRDLLVDPDVPTWEVNIIKSIVSLLQLDTQGENAKDRKSTQYPTNRNSSVTYEGVEDSVNGMCTVLYAIEPLVENYHEFSPDMVPMPHLRGTGRYYKVSKGKMYDKCSRRQAYHYDFNDPSLQRNPGKQSELIDHMSLSEAVISGDLKSFTIHSAVMKNIITITNKKDDPALGTVNSVLKLHLIKKEKLPESSVEIFETNTRKNKLQSTGNLLYVYNNPFSETENRKERRPTISKNSAQVESMEMEKLSSENELSSWSSSEELSDVKSQTKLHLPPNAPLLPFFVGNKGKSIVMSGKFDAVKEARDLISQITDELQTPSQKMGQEMLEKFTNLKNLLRTMNRKQYEELQNAVLTKGEHSEDHKDAWPVLRDAVAHAATGPALLTIKSWLTSRLLKGVEAARVVSQISKNVREPSDKYLMAFYDMMQEPWVSEQELIHTTALLTFAKLLRNSQKSYPIRSDGTITQKNNNDVVNRYIPYLADQLKQAYREDNLKKIQTCIMALGMTEHPKIIPVFEPYLENTKPATKYQRLLMVASLGTLARTHPKLVGPIFYKLYVGKEENHEIRCLAVQHYILTNPPQIMLKHIAHSTHEEENYHVNSAIKTTLESLADSKIPALGDLHDKARAVTSFLSPVKSKYGSSGGLYIDFANSIIQGFSLQTVVGGDSEIPMYAHASVHTWYDSFQDGRPTLEAAYGVSSVRQLLNNIDKLWQKESGKVNEKFMRKTRAEEIAETLKIKPENLDKLEGSLFLNTLFGFIYYPFDSNTLQQVPVMWKNMLKKDHGIRSTGFYNYERTVTLPLETGLPCVFSLEIPTLVKLQVESKKEESCNGCRNGVLKVVLGRKVQKRFGFIAPFEHTQYMAGTDDSRMLQLPLEYEVKFDMTRQNLELKVRPNIPKDQMDSQLSLLHYSTVPFTSRHDIFNLQPLCLDENTHKALDLKQQKNSLKKDMLTVWLESDGVEKEKIHLEKELQDMWEQDDGRYKKLDVLLNVEEARKSGVRLNIAYDNMEIRDNKDDSEQSQEVELQGIPEPSWKPDSEDRKLQIMKTLQKGLRSGKVHVVDITYKTPRKEQVLTFSLAQSNVDQKSRIYVYWNTQTPEENQNKYEVCYVQELQSSPSTPLDFEYTLRNTPTDKFWAEILFGRNCQGGEKIRIEGHASRSNELEENLEYSKLTEQCREEMRGGDKVGRACQMAIGVAEVRDTYQVSLKTANEYLRRLVHEYVEMMPLVLRKVNVRTDFMSHPDSNPMKLKWVRVPEEKPLIERVKVTEVEARLIGEILGIYKRTVPSRTDSELIGLRKEEMDVCTLNKDMMTTYDNRAYSVMMGGLKHVIMTTYRQQDPENPERTMDIPEDMKVAVVTTDMDDGSRKLFIFLDNQKVLMQKVNKRLEAFVDGQPVSLSKNRWYRHSQDGKTVFEIIELPDGSIKFTSDKYGLEAVYDGQHIKLKASDKFRNAVRGLCGNYDSDPSNDFLIPRNCILANVEEFTAMYALLDKDSEGPVVENRRKAEHAYCLIFSKQEPRQRNVISDREAGRPLTEDVNWGYHPRKRQRQDFREQDRNSKEDCDDVGTQKCSTESNIVYRTKVFEEGGELCFTTRPVPTCASDTRPIERKPKEFNLFCMPINEESRAIKRRVEEGARPDFTRRPVSRSHVFQVPSYCMAA
ncbi:PREDICTED: vitellogenin-3-like [Vollenhovia emeryi]|uniref:vitellogenin-3-like n=1 Tax=Vollenhovia emeryi TaxID=411798 RepID=UPI0005F49B68|nr:PREDICTED: vitellogenin-3-like [Vollenhovia emeryi]